MSPLRYTLAILLAMPYCHLFTVAGRLAPTQALRQAAGAVQHMFLPIVRDEECVTHSASMTLSASATTLRVGEAISVTSTLRNSGCLALGVPMHTLGWDSAALKPVFSALSPLQVTHHWAVSPGSYDQAEFALLSVGPGEAILRAHTSFEVHIGYPGPAYWSGASAPPLVITVLP